MSTLQCARCRKPVSSPEELLKHASEKHGITQSNFPCHDCRLTGFTTEQALIRHRQNCWGPSWAADWHKLQRGKSLLCNGKPQTSDKKRGPVPAERSSLTISEAAISARKGNKPKVLRSPVSPTIAETSLRPARQGGSGLRTRQPVLDSRHTGVDEAASQAASTSAEDKTEPKLKKLNSTVLSSLGSSSMTPKPARRRSRATSSPSDIFSTPPPSESPPPNLVVRKSDNSSYIAELASTDISNVGVAVTVEGKPRSGLPKNSKKLRELSSLVPPAPSNVTSKPASAILSSSLASKSSKRPGMKEACASVASQKSNTSPLQLRRQSLLDAGIAAPSKSSKTRVSQGVSTARLEPEGGDSDTRGTVNNGVRDPSAAQAAVSHLESQSTSRVKPRAGTDPSIQERLDSIEHHSKEEVLVATSDPPSGEKLAALRKRTPSKSSVAAFRRRSSGKLMRSTKETSVMSLIMSCTSDSRLTASADVSAGAVCQGVHGNPRDLIPPSNAPETTAGATSHVDMTASVELPPSENLLCPSPLTDSLLEPAISNQTVLNSSIECLPTSSHAHTSLPEMEPAIQSARLPSEVVGWPTEVNNASSGLFTSPLEFKNSEDVLSRVDVPNDCGIPKNPSLVTKPSLNCHDPSLSCTSPVSNACSETSDGHREVSSPDGELLIDEGHAAVCDRNPSHSSKPLQLSTSAELDDLVSHLPSTLSPYSRTDSVIALPKESSGDGAVDRADLVQVTASPVPDQPNTGSVSPIFEAAVVDEKSLLTGDDKSYSQSPKNNCRQTGQTDPVGAQTTTLEQEAPVATDTNQEKVTDTAATKLTVSSTPKPIPDSCGDKMALLAETERLSNGDPKTLGNPKDHTDRIKAIKVADAIERHVTPLKKLIARKNVVVASPAKRTTATSQSTKTVAGRETGSKASATAGTGEVTLLDWDSFIALPVRKSHATGGGSRPSGTSVKQTNKSAIPKPESSSSSEGCHLHQFGDANGHPSEPTTTAGATAKEHRRPLTPSGDSSHSNTSTPRPPAHKRVKLAEVVESGRVSDRAEESRQSPSLAKGSTIVSTKEWTLSCSSRVESLTSDEDGSINQSDSSTTTVPGDQTIPASTLENDGNNGSASSSPLSSDPEQNPSDRRPRPFLRSSAFFKGLALSLFGLPRVPPAETASTLPEAQVKPASVSSDTGVEKPKENDAVEKRLPSNYHTPDKSESSGLDTPIKPSVSSLIKNQSRFAVVHRRSTNVTASPPVKRSRESTEALRCQACGLLTSRRCALQMHIKRRHPDLYAPVGAVARAALNATATTTPARSRSRSRGPQKRRPTSLSQVTWRCPGCYPSSNSFLSALDLLSHLPHCRRTAGSRASGGHHGAGGVKWSPWPEPLSLPGTGFGCCICGLLFASASRLDRHRRASHDSKRTTRIGVAGIGSDAFIA